jgi:dihydropteroate synthase
MRKTKLVGILNISPESFSDGPKVLDNAELIKSYHNLINSGADYVDIGAQSTTYGATLLTPEAEIERLKPIIEQILDHQKTSIDSFNYDTVSFCYDHGVKFINDVSAGRNKDILKLVSRDPAVKYVLTYSLTIPANKAVRAKSYEQIIDFAVEKLKELEDLGISRSQIIFDPGIGFATSPTLAFEVLADPQKLWPLNVELYIGHSRKSFLASLNPLPPAERDPETLAASIQLFNKVDFLRVHNIELHKRTLFALSKIRGS